MKSFLLTLFLLNSVFAKAQNVLIKDSSVAFGETTVSLYTYNADCLASSITTPRTQLFISYYPNKLPYQYLGYVYNTDSGKYVKQSFTTYLYNTAGKRVSSIFQLYRPAQDVFINSYKDSTIYDEHNYLVKEIIQSGVPATNSWETYVEIYYYNNEAGKPDSAFTDYIGYDAGDYRDYYNYYTNSTKQYERLTYTTALGGELSVAKQTFYHDSANYVSRDSLVNEYLGADSIFFENGVNVDHFFYNQNKELVRHENVFYSSSNTQFTNNYYFYGPCSSVLPVTLLNFNGEWQQNKASLRWQTTNETNTSSFTVERSVDGEHFTSVGIVAAAGKSSGIKNYTFTDINAFLLQMPAVYYRLVQKDNDGSESISKIMMLSIEKSMSSVYISPNPVFAKATIYANTTLNNAIIIVRDMQGKLLYSCKQNVVAGSPVVINTSSFAKGMYVVTIQTATKRQQIKMIKE